MSKNRIILQNWIVDLGYDPRNLEPQAITDQSSDADDNVERIKEEVAQAVSSLPKEERELIERFHFMGQSYRELSASTGRAIHRLEAMHQRAVRRLRKLLNPLVKELYGLSDKSPPACPLCRSPARAEIDRVIAEKPESETWRTTLTRIREDYGITVKSPQLIIGHRKYH